MKTNVKNSAVQITGLQRSFGKGKLKVDVLKGIDFLVERGEYVAIMGKSGAGKSTLLYQISLLDEPTAGEISLLGEDTSTFNESERTTFRLAHLGYIFQDYALVPELTARENVELPLIMLGYERSRSKKIAESALERVGLQDKFDNRPNQLSGGQQQTRFYSESGCKKSGNSVCR